MLASVERLTVPFGFRHRVHGLGGVVAVDTGRRGRRALEPVAFVEGPVTECRPDCPAVDVLADLAGRFAHFASPLLHALGERSPALGRERRVGDRRSWDDADPGQPRANGRFFGAGRRELEYEREVREEVALDEFLVDLREVNRRSGGWGGLLQVRGERLHRVAGLDLLHVRHVVGAHELRPVDRQREVRRRPEDLPHARRLLALPVRPDHEVVARFVARGAAADVAVIEGVAVAQLHRVVAAYVDGWH
jgi:hypothetical protein